MLWLRINEKKLITDSLWINLTDDPQVTGPKFCLSAYANENTSSNTVAKNMSSNRMNNKVYWEQ
jgi:hypothetical protein